MLASEIHKIRRSNFSSNKTPQPQTTNQKVKKAQLNSQKDSTEDSQFVESHKIKKLCFNFNQNREIPKSAEIHTIKRTN